MVQTFSDVSYSLSRWKANALAFRSSLIPTHLFPVDVVYNQLLSNFHDSD